MAYQQFFPFIAEGSDWASWNGNLVMFYGQEPIPYIADEENWLEVAKNVAQLPTFSVYPVPDPDLFKTWQEWANEFTMIVNGPSQ